MKLVNSNRLATLMLAIFLSCTETYAENYSSEAAEEFSNIFSPQISETLVQEFFSYGVKTGKDVEDVYNRGNENEFFNGMNDITEVELLNFLKYEKNKKEIDAKNLQAKKEEVAFNLGICAGAIEVSNRAEGESEYTRKMKNRILPQMQEHATLIQAACPDGLNATCFESMPLETRIYFNAFGKAQKELSRPQSTTFMKKELIGNDPATIGIVLVAHCPTPL